MTTEIKKNKHKLYITYFIYIYIYLYFYSMPYELAFTKPRAQIEILYVSNMIVN